MNLQRKRLAFFQKILQFSMLIFISFAFFTQSVFAGSTATDGEFSVESAENKKVLFLSSYSETFFTNPDVLEGIRSVFSDEKIVLDTDFMDAKRFPEQENIDNFYQSFKYKMSHTYQYDAVIVADDTALQFVMDHQDELFYHLPIYFIGINDEERALKAEQNPYITGLFEKTSLLQDNIDLALKINPDARQIVGIADGTITGEGDLQQFLNAQTDYPDLTFQTISTADYSFEELGQKMETYGDDTILVLFTISVDKDNAYMNINQQLRFASAHSNIPVYRIALSDVGVSGLIGGKMTDYHAVGVKAAEFAVRIINGEAVQEMQLDTEIPYRYIFDAEVLEKYNIDRSLLPKDSVYMNEKINPLEEYRNYIIVTGIFTLFLLVLAIVLMLDNINRRKIQKELAESNKKLGVLSQKYEAAMANTNSTVWELELNTMTLIISDNFDKIFNMKLLKRGKLFQIIEKMTDEKSQMQIMHAVQTYIDTKYGEINLTFPVIDQEAMKHWILMKGNGVFDEKENLIEITGIFLDITNEKERQEYISYFAKHDFLTGLPNRLDFEETLQKELDDQNSGALMLFDIDNFKTINDTMGHAFGDEILKKIAKRLNTLNFENFYASRMGGDEFLILLKNITDREFIKESIEQITEVITRPYRYLKVEEYLSFSMGITIYPNDSNSINHLLMNVDTAMYYVKKNGKNNYEFYYDEMKDKLKKRKQVETIIRQAVKDEGFELKYQPQVDAKTGYISGYEALIRLKNENISPGVFIPIAEETGDIIAIGRWVVREVVHQMYQWKQKGWEIKKVAINYSIKQLNDKDFLFYLQQMTEQYGISPHNIEIEITERIMMEKTDDTMIFLKEIRNAGYMLSLDDFGSGYSSLSYLTYLPANVIKLDKSINDKFLEMEDTRVMESIISLAHGLGMEIVAEGIEEKEKFDRIKACGCDVIQGYYFSRPLSVKEVDENYHHVYEV